MKTLQQQLQDFLYVAINSNKLTEGAKLDASKLWHDLETPQNLHTFKVIYLGATAKLPTRTKIHSERFKESIYINNDDTKFDDCRDTQERAVIELKERGYNIIAIGEGDGCMYVMSDTFKSLKDKS
jgi:hypothetical protein